MGRSRRTARQVAVVLLICGGHVALYLGVSPELSPGPAPGIPDELTAVWLPPPVERAARPPHPGPAPAGGERRAPEAAPAAPRPEPPPQPAPPPQSGATDWVAAAARAARGATHAEPRRGFGIPDPGQAGPAPRPEFGWSHARTHPIEMIESGGFVYNINDRCSIVVVFIPLPFCRMGRIPPRGDLLDHLHDAPTAGDWKDGP